MHIKEKIKDKLADEYELVEEVLDSLGFCNIHEFNGYWRFGFDPFSDPSAINLYKGTLQFKNYKHTEIRGDIFALVQYRLGCSFNSAISYLADRCGFEYACEEVVETHVLPFGGYFKNLTKLFDSSHVDVHNYSEFEKYRQTFSELLIKDGISLQAQEYFDIRYDHYSNRIVFPIYNKKGLVGILGRYNTKIVDEHIAKYLPIIRYPKNRVVFGLVENLRYLRDSRVIVVESEKSVMRAYSMGYRNVVAMGGNSISEQQKNLIYSTYPKEIVVALDEGIELEHIKTEVERLRTKNVLFRKTRLGYIDPKGLGKKNCIFDESEEVCGKKMEEIKWL